MTPEQTLDLVVHILHAESQPLKATDIGRKALVEPQFRSHCVTHGYDVESFDDEYSLGKHIGLVISRHINGTASAKQVLTGNRSRGWTLAPAAMHRLRVSHKDLMRPADAQFVGLVGEYAVMSELLACNWNVAKLPHDDGVDIIATKGQQLRTVQVKTAHAAKDSATSYAYTVTRRAHEDYDRITHYYVLVLRRIDGHRYINDFVILNSSDVHELVASGGISMKGDVTWSIKVRVDAGRVLIGDLDFSGKLNRFGTLFR